MREYLYDRIDMLERENMLLRDLDNCRRMIEKLNIELTMEKNKQVAYRMKLLKLRTAYDELCVKKNNRARLFDKELAAQLSYSEE